MRLQVCGCSTVWGAAIDSDPTTAATTESSKHGRGGVVEDNNSSAEARGAGVVLSSMAGRPASKQVSWERRSPGQKVGGNAVLLRGACGGYGPKRRTRPCIQTGMCEEKRQRPPHPSPTRTHARRATATGEQQPWKVTLGARMQRCKTRHNP